MDEIDWPEDAIGMFSMRLAPTWPSFFVRSKEWTDFSCGEHSGGYHGEQTSGSSYHVFDSVWQFTERPTHQWLGDGLPPVGIDIEVLHELYGWIGARVVGADGEAAIVRTNDGYAGVYPHQMRAIRTPEQIAAEEREKAIDEMARSVGMAGQPCVSTLDVLVHLYDAGYRKQEPKP